jgi:hypothetical protein
LSDVVKALNVSAALSVKVGNITGSGSGSYIDEDKVKESEINFIIQVKVTNLTTKLPINVEFNEIPLKDPNDFTKIYGDTFISGFLEGGEFFGLISMKVHDVSKIQKIKADLELAFSAVSGKGSGGYNTTTFSNEAETSISVNWSGGGQIKDPEAKWDMDTMLRVAAHFPEMCAKCPQKTSAILTRYTSLLSFHKYAQKYTPLTYENAGVYTADLLDDYMWYKLMAKDLRVIDDDLDQYERGEDPDRFEVTPEGLDQAQRLIRQQMVKIVNQVDAVKLNPKRAEDALNTTEPIYINPGIIAAKLPVRKGTTPRAWQWARVSGKDSPGNEAFSYKAAPRDIMIAINKWEANHPGEIIRGFSTSGSVKSKIPKSSEFINSPDGGDLYVRVLYNEDWDFFPGKDTDGEEHDDIPGVQFSEDGSHEVDPIEAMIIIGQLDEVDAFHSWGAGLSSSTKLEHSEHWGEQSHLGVWVKRPHKLAPA